MTEADVTSTMDYIERTLGELTNELRGAPQHVVSEEGRLFLEGHGSIKAPTRRSVWPPLILAVGVLLFGSFLIAHNTGADLSAGLFMLTAIGGFAITLLGGIGFVAWIMTKPVLRDATHVVEGSVQRIKQMRNSPMRIAYVRFRSPTSGKDRKTTFLVLPEHRDRVGTGTKVAVAFAADHDAGEVL